jgi:hypothetical protein
MSQAIAPSTKTGVSTSSNIFFCCYVTLSEAEQIIIEKEVSDFVWAGGSAVTKSTGVIEKYRLEQLIYQGDSDYNEGVALKSIVVRGFRKDGALKFRETTFYCGSPALDKVISQIPDSYHDHARKAFAEHAIKLQNELTELSNTGVKIG